MSVTMREMLEAGVLIVGLILGDDLWLNYAG